MMLLHNSHSTDAWAVWLITFLITGCLLPSPRQAADTAPLGSIGNPVRADGVRGQREYLGRLRCKDGKAPAFGRLQTMGRGTDGHDVDRYLVQCEGNEAVYIHMDFYHTRYREQRPVPGFDLVADLPAAAGDKCPPPVPYEGYAFLDIEVSRRARLLNQPAMPAPENELPALLEFVVGTDGAVEPGSVRVLDTLDERLRAKPAAALKQFRFSPAEHPPGCPVRQRFNGVFILDRTLLESGPTAGSDSQ